METIKVSYREKELEFRKSIPIEEYCSAVEAVAHTVVSDENGYRAQVHELCIIMTMLRLYAIGYEEATMETAWEFMSNYYDAIPYEAPEATRFCESCENAIAYLRGRSPIYTLIDGMKSAIVSMGKEDPDFLINVVNTLKEIAGGIGGDMK